MTVTSTDFVTPLALVAVTFRSKVPAEGDDEVRTVRVANAELDDPDGMVTLEGNSWNVTPVGAFQAAVSCAVSLTPLSDRKVMSDDLSEEASSERDEGEAETV
jgi:hypothetical protein